MVMMVKGNPDKELRYRIECKIKEAELRIKDKPFESVLVTGAVGFLAGALAVYSFRKAKKGCRWC